jgi:hypothetical protein
MLNSLCVVPVVRVLDAPPDGREETSQVVPSDLARYSNVRLPLAVGRSRRIEGATQVNAIGGADSVGGEGRALGLPNPQSVSTTVAPNATVPARKAGWPALPGSRLIGTDQHRW